MIMWGGGGVCVCCHLLTVEGGQAPNRSSWNPATDPSSHKVIKSRFPFFGYQTRSDFNEKKKQQQQKKRFFIFITELIADK